ncbi:hypothetical protein M0657_011720 [Pyricularia oryzae]|nr:hypothetical protein M0657_011720 [Pyricularia oryzae]
MYFWVARVLINHVNGPLTKNRTTHLKPIVTLRRSIPDPLQISSKIHRNSQASYMPIFPPFCTPTTIIKKTKVLPKMPAEEHLLPSDLSINVLFCQHDHANHPTEFDARRIRHDRCAQTAATEAPGSNCRDHSGSGGSSSGWDQILSQASAIGIIYRDFPVRALCYPIYKILNSKDDHSPDIRLTHRSGQPKEGSSYSSSSRTNRSGSNRGGHSSAESKGDSQLEAIQQARHDALALSVCNLTLTPVPEHIVAVTLCFAFCSGSQLPIRSNRCNSLMTTYAVLVSADCWPGQI